MCCTWFAHDCAWATWAYVLETVRRAVRRLSEISNSAFECDYCCCYYYSSAGPARRVFLIVLIDTAAHKPRHSHHGRKSDGSSGTGRTNKASLEVYKRHSLRGPACRCVNPHWRNVHSQHGVGVGGRGGGGGVVEKEEAKGAMSCGPVFFFLGRGGVVFFFFWFLFVCLVCCLTSPFTRSCISGTDLLRQFYVLPHTETEAADQSFPSHPVTVYWHRADQSQGWPYSTRRLAGEPLECQSLSHWYDSTPKKTQRKPGSYRDLPLSRRAPNTRPPWPGLKAHFLSP